jgi:O-antigen ligase
VHVTARPASSEAGLSFSGVALLAALLAFAPLIKGGNRPLPLLILETAAAILLCLMLIRPQIGSRPPRFILLALAVLVALPLIQLIPVPMSLWEYLPGRRYYAEAMAGVGITPQYHAATLLPNITEAAWLTLLVPVAVFLATLATDQQRLKQLVNLFIGLALLQAIIGLAQFGTGSLSVLLPEPGSRFAGISAHGTYANSDHLAGLLEMALPVVLGLLIANIQLGGGKKFRASLQLNIRQRLSRLFNSGIRFNLVALYVAAGLGIVLGLIFSRSRTGIGLAMLGILLSALAFGNHLGGKRSSRVITIFTVIGTALALEIGLAPVLARFASQGVTDPYRWSIYTGTLQGIREFFPLGSGIGTYPSVFRRFQPGDVPEFVNHAHNDYLEWLFEGGLPAALLMFAFLALYFLRWRQIWPREEQWSTYAFMRISAGLGLLLIGLHGLIDFNLHIPANAVYFAFLAGVFFHPETPAPQVPGVPLKKTPVVARPETPPAMVAKPQSAETPNRNPFAD